MDVAQLRDLATMRTFLAGPAVLALFDTPWIFIYLLVIGLFHPILGVIAAVAAALLVASAWLADRLSADSLGRSQEAGAKASAFVQAGLRAADVVKAHGMAGGLARTWFENHDKALGEARTATRITATLGGATRTLRQLLQIVMLGVGAWLVIDLNASAGVTIAATILLGRMLAPLEGIAANWKTIAEARLAWRRLQNAPVASQSATREFSLPVPEGKLEVAGVFFAPSAGAAPTLRNVTVTLEPGEIMAIVGPSGSGKSTLSRLVTGIWTPTSGSVRLDGIEMRNWDRDALGPHIGYCPQDVQLITGTVAQNIARFGEVESDKVVDAARHAGCHDLIARLPDNYSTQIGEGGGFLSGGQRQRVALARALYGNPRLVVLDEPNANLDSDGERALEQVIVALRERKVTTIIVTQRMEIVEFADKVLMLRDGMVERIGRKRTDEEANAKPLQIVAGG
jgi:PrtD family type I secretion system ABC transporter